MSRRTEYVCRLSDSGTVELLADEETIWASDTDEDFIGEFGLHVVPAMLEKVLNYLVKYKYMTDRQADDCWVEEPDDTDQANGAAPLEGEYIPAENEDEL